MKNKKKSKSLESNSKFLIICLSKKIYTYLKIPFICVWKWNFDEYIHIIKRLITMTPQTIKKIYIIAIQKY